MMLFDKLVRFPFVPSLSKDERLDVTHRLFVHGSILRQAQDHHERFLIDALLLSVRGELVEP